MVQYLGFGEGRSTAYHQDHHEGKESRHCVFLASSSSMDISSGMTHVSSKLWTLADLVGLVSISLLT